MALKGLVCAVVPWRNYLLSNWCNFFLDEDHAAHSQLYAWKLWI